MLEEQNQQAGATLLQAVGTLEEEIVLGILHPRERLVEDDLLKRFSMKRHVVRQLLAELERMGLVERKRNIGALVRSYSVQEVLNLYAVRELLETHCASLIQLPVPPAAIEGLVAVQRTHDDAVARGDLRQVFRSNLAFHQYLFGLCDNPVLEQAIQVHAQRAHAIRTSTLVVPALLERARAEHWRIIDALRSGDAAQLVNVCRDHLRPSRDAYIQAHPHLLPDAAPSSPRSPVAEPNGA